MLPVDLVVRARFNPESKQTRFGAVMKLIDQVAVHERLHLVVDNRPGMAAAGEGVGYVVGQIYPPTTC